MGDIWEGPGIAGLSDFEQIGRGGFSVVYRARQESLDRPVAVKLLLTDISADKDIRRFHRECAILGQLGRHPHIIDVYDAGITRDRRPYIVMRLYERGTLAARVRDDGPLLAEEAVGILIDVADALQTAHDHAVIHRDIKLDNLLIDDDGSVVLTDFGVAAVTDGSTTMTTSMPFTEAYVAPEVLDSNKYSPASDVYSLAASGYAMLTGNAPFHSTTGTQRLIAIASQEPDPITAPGVPLALSEAITGAMAKDPANRPTSPKAFAETVQSALRSVQSAPRPVAVEGALTAERRPTAESADRTVMRHPEDHDDSGPTFIHQSDVAPSKPKRLAGMNKTEETSATVQHNAPVEPSATKAIGGFPARKRSGTVPNMRPTSTEPRPQTSRRIRTSKAAVIAGVAVAGVLAAGVLVTMGFLIPAGLPSVERGPNPVDDGTDPAPSASSSPASSPTYVPPATTTERTAAARYALPRLKQKYPKHTFGKVQPALSDADKPWVVSIAGKKAQTWWWSNGTQNWYLDDKLLNMRNVRFDRIKQVDVTRDGRKDFLLLGTALDDGYPYGALLVNHGEYANYATFRGSEGRYGAVFNLVWDGSSLLSDYAAYDVTSAPDGYGRTRWVRDKKKDVFVERPA